MNDNNNIFAYFFLKYCSLLVSLLQENSGKGPKEFQPYCPCQSLTFMGLTLNTQTCISKAAVFSCEKIAVFSEHGKCSATCRCSKSAAQCCQLFQAVLIWRSCVKHELCCLAWSVGERTCGARFLARNDLPFLY